MKKKGSKCDYIESRNENLKREFLARVGRNGRTVKQTIEAMTRVPADRFYISEERAEAEIKRIVSEDCEFNLPEAGEAVRNKMRQVMIREILRRVKTLMESRPGLTLRDAIYEVVNSPAPCFYLTPGSMRTILYRALRS